MHLTRSKTLTAANADSAETPHAYALVSWIAQLFLVHESRNNQNKIPEKGEPTLGFSHSVAMFVAVYESPMQAFSQSHELRPVPIIHINDSGVLRPNKGPPGSSDLSPAWYPAEQLTSGRSQLAIRGGP